MITRLDHANIVVSKLDVMVPFYRDVLGFEELSRLPIEGEWLDTIVGLKGARGTVVFLGANKGETSLELIEYHSPAGSRQTAGGVANTHGIRHLAFTVDDIHADVARLRAKGVQFFSDPVTAPSIPGMESRGRKTLCYFHDPEGNLLELCQNGARKGDSVSSHEPVR